MSETSISELTEQHPQLLSMGSTLASDAAAELYRRQQAALDNARAALAQLLIATGLPLDQARTLSSPGAGFGHELVTGVVSTYLAAMRIADLAERAPVPQPHGIDVSRRIPNPEA